MAGIILECFLRDDENRDYCEYSFGTSRIIWDVHNFLKSRWFFFAFIHLIFDLQI